MRRTAVDLAVLFVLATIVLGVLLAFRPIQTTTVLHGYVLAVGAIAMLAAVAATHAAVPERRRSDFDAALRRPRPPDRRPPQLERVERGVTLGIAHAFELHARLRPQLREIAAARLAARRGVALDSAAGRAALGEDAWELLRPDRPLPDDRFAPGVDAGRLGALVDVLERL